MNCGSFSSFVQFLNQQLASHRKYKNYSVFLSKQCIIFFPLKRFSSIRQQFDNWLNCIWEIFHKRIYNLKQNIVWMKEKKNSCKLEITENINNKKKWWIWNLCVETIRQGEETFCAVLTFIWLQWELLSVFASVSHIANIIVYLVHHLHSAIKRILI